MSDEAYDGEEYETPVLIPDQMDGANEFGEFYDQGHGRVASGTPPTLHYVNESGLPDDIIQNYMNKHGGLQEISSVIERWSQSLASAPLTQTLDVFNRNRWRQNELHVHAVMSRVAWSVENDYTLSTMADVIEGLMWAKCRFELIDTDQQDMWNQWAADVNLDEFLRQCGREEFKLSQFYVGLWWSRKVYSVSDDQIADQIDEFEDERKARDYEDAVEARDAFIAANKGVEGFIMPPELPQPPVKTKGGNRKRKKKFPVTVPTEMTIFDPTKVLPVGTLMFGRERFAYIANRGEHEAFNEVMTGNIVDDTVLQLIEGKYQPTAQDKKACADLGVDWNMLWLFKQDAVFRHTMTKSHYERYSPVRLKTVLPLLEMKQHLQASDRASLIGNTNFIVVITKGTDKLPARPAEIENLQQQARIIARLPVLVGDHRLEVKIVSPPVDHTLQEDRWMTLDARLIFAALRTYAPQAHAGRSSSSSGASGGSEASKVVAKGLESRRHMIMRTVESSIFQKILDKNPDILDEMPGLLFNPKRITLNFEADVIAQVLQLRDRGDISRETTLEELDYDQDTEVLRRGRERALYDKIFESQTPFSSPAQNPYGAAPGAPAAPGAVPGAAIPGVKPPQLPAGGNQNVVGNGGDPAVGGRGGAAAKKAPAKPGGRPPGVSETQPRKSSGS